MKIILDVKDEKASFMMEVLKNFKDVKAKPLTNYKADVLEGIKEAIEEVKLIKQGKLKGISAKELFNEL
jgi:DNA-binding protein